MTGNSLLNTMIPSDRSIVLERSELVTVPSRKQLEVPNRPPSHVYFFESGAASLVYQCKADHVAEVGLVGKEGCTGCGLVLGVEASPQGVIMQVCGSAYRLRSDDFTNCLEQSQSLRSLLLRFVHVQIIQHAEAAMAASKGTIVERLARWLLMVSDRVAPDPMPLTHELIALLLGTRRASVTVALADLSRRNLIKATRGLIEISDRDRLTALAAAYYGAPMREYSRLFPVSVDSSQFTGPDQIAPPSTEMNGRQRIASKGIYSVSRPGRSPD
jgi:CRP-like cAMP-binding protein